MSESLTLELLKRQIRLLARREVEIERTKKGKYICKFVDFNMSPLALIGDTEEEAYQKLLQYLKGRNSLDEDEPEPPQAA